MNLAERHAAFLAAHPPRRLMLDGAPWELIEAGAGETVVLLPGGFGVAATSFLYLADLSHDYHTIALTYPPYLERIDGLADGVAAVLDSCGVGCAHVVGGSASGAVAQVLVRRHPARVAALILAQTGPPRPGRAPLAQACADSCCATPAALLLALVRLAVLAFLREPAAGQAFWRAHFAAVVGAQGRAALAARFQILADYDRRCRFTPGDLDAWPGRVTIIEAARDGLLSASDRVALRALYPRAVVLSLSDGRHLDSVTNPSRQIAALRAGLRAWGAEPAPKEQQRTEPPDEPIAH